ncbi:UNVERIFIED_CONTAM: hypothetical protein Sradi_0923800 [Sesamum radiatum]|uniref:Uncharacterized protein n=1 Tax=Sesamum radiatum TaxID=300843 RepID=A0AAW2V4C8_SESRA
MTASRLGFGFERPRPPLPKMVKRILLPDFLFKFNCDDTSKGNPGPMGSGSLLHDRHENMVFAFHDFLDIRTTTFAELYAVVWRLQGTRAYNKFGFKLMLSQFCLSS